MAMNDEETVALIAGGHTFGKGHGAADADEHVGPEPEAASVEEQGFGWKNSFGTGKGVDTITSGLEGAWTDNPIAWDNGYFHNLFAYEWELGQGAGGAKQWYPAKGGGAGSVPDAHDPTRSHPPTMFTTDIALIRDPSYTEISKRFHDHPDQFADAFGRAWYKLCHRDMGPHTRCLGSLVPPPQLWQDPLPATTGALMDASQVAELKSTIMGSGLSISQLVRVAWGSASTYRVTDHRGGANGARIRLAPQKNWAANSPDDLEAVLTKLEEIRTSAQMSNAVSLADLVVLGGCAAVEEAAKKGGHSVTVPFSPGRTDATQQETDVESFAPLETPDGFRNHRSTAAQLVDKAYMLTLSAPEMTVLVGGMRVLGANVGGSDVGVFTQVVETLTNDWFVNLLEMDTTWKISPQCKYMYEGRAHGSDEVKWRGTEADLIFGSDAELRNIAEYYACDDSKQTFVEDFAAAWAKVMNLDRFDL